MKKTFCIIFSIIFLAIGCISTPEQDSIIGKTDGNLQEKIYAEPVDDYRYDAPSTLNLAPIGDHHFKVIVDATVHIPDTVRYPVMEVEQPFLTVEQARQFMRKMAKGSPVYTFESEVPQTKSEMLKEITLLQDMLTNPEKYLLGDVSNKETEEQLDQIREELSYWQNEYLNAPEQFTPAEVDLANLEFDFTRQMMGAVHAGKQRDAYLSVSEGGTVSFNNPDDGIGLVFHYDRDNDFTHLNGVTITKDEAIQIGKDFLAELGESGFEAAHVVVGYNSPRGESDLPIDQWQQSYVIYYTRSVEGVPTTYVPGLSTEQIFSIGDLEKELYAPPVEQEYVEMIIRDSGVNYMFWSMPTKQTKLVNNNVSLLPFEQIVEQLQTYLSYQTSASSLSAPKNEDKTIIINRMDLGMVQIRKQFDPDTMLMIPAWTFWGEVNGGGGSSDPSGWSIPISSEPTEQIALIINAIDGSIIDRVQGY